MFWQMMGQIFFGIAQISTNPCLSPIFLLFSMPTQNAFSLSTELDQSFEPYHPFELTHASLLPLKLTKIKQKFTSLTADLAAF